MECRTIKKTEHENLSQAEKRRYDDIVRIQAMLAEGYAPVEIKELLHTTYNRIRRYATGDPVKLCRFGSARVSNAELYKKEIIALLSANTSLKYAHEQITLLGYRDKRTAFENYCRKLIRELDIPYTPRRNKIMCHALPNPEKPKFHYVSKAELLKFLWSGSPIEDADLEYILATYPVVSELAQCISDFRKMYKDKDIMLLEQFIEYYSSSQIAPIKSFASGLKSDMEAVKNSVTSELSNGFVEGNNNKIKVIKRTMYGRAKIDLLRIKVLFAR